MHPASSSASSARSRRCRLAAHASLCSCLYDNWHSSVTQLSPTLSPPSAPTFTSSRGTYARELSSVKDRPSHNPCDRYSPTSVLLLPSAARCLDYARLAERAYPTSPASSFSLPTSPGNPIQDPVGRDGKSSRYQTSTSIDHTSREQKPSVVECSAAEKTRTLASSRTDLPSSQCCLQDRLETLTATLRTHSTRACWKPSRPMQVTQTLSSQQAILPVVSCPSPQIDHPTLIADTLLTSTDAVWEETQESTSIDILETYAIMRSALDMPLFGTLGNQCVLYEIMQMYSLEHADTSSMYTATSHLPTYSPHQATLEHFKPLNGHTIPTIPLGEIGSVIKSIEVPL